jgi:hypothetical protein
VLVELSVMEQRYQAVLAVVQDGSHRPASPRAGGRIPHQVVDAVRRAPGYATRVQVVPSHTHVSPHQ